MAKEKTNFKLKVLVTGPDFHTAIHQVADDETNKNNGDRVTVKTILHGILEKDPRIASKLPAIRRQLTKDGIKYDE